LLLPFSSGLAFPLALITGVFLTDFLLALADFLVDAFPLGLAFLALTIFLGLLMIFSF
jgi:hypothetical protein